MYLLYLDWNAMKGLKGIPTGIFADFAAILERYQDRFWIPYSSTHLDDLARGFDPSDERKIKLTNDDLEFIGRLTQDRCLQTYQGQNHAMPDRRSPIEFFYSHYEAQQEVKTDFATLAAQKDGPLDSWGLIREFILDLPAVSFPEEAHSTIIGDLFPGWGSQGTLRSVVQDVAALTTRANTDPSYSTDLRRLIRSSLSMLHPTVVSSASAFDAFTHIEKLLASSMGGQSVFALMDSFLKNPLKPSEPPTLFQRFVQYYQLLDLFGYHSDKLTNKNFFPNIVGDATHAFLAGHCDFFITNDKDLRPKAQAVYRRLHTHTHVMSVPEFVEAVASGLAEYTPATLSQYISAAIQDGKRVPSDATQEVLGYFLPYALLDVFNAFEKRSKTSITFFRIETTYRMFTLTPVIEQVIAFLDNCLGPNDNGKSKLDRSIEVQQLESGTWIGRQWRRPTSTTTLLYGDSLELTIEFIEYGDFSKA